jgi:tetratricopeptide (TPR) repeat protein
MVTRVRAALLCWLLAWTSSAAAQQEAEASEASAARLAFERGVELLRAQRWSEAEADFRASIAAVPRASAQYDLALVVFKQGRLRESVALLQQLLNDDASEADPRYRDAATALLSEAMSGLAMLHLTVAPATAEVRIDGELVALGGEERSVPIDPGRHRIEVSASGFAPQSLDMDVVPHAEETRTIALQSANLPGVDRGALAAPAAALSTAPQRSWLARTGPWLAIGLGGALLATSLAVGAMAQHADNEFSKHCPTHHDCDPDLKPQRDHVARLGTASDVLLVSGAVVAAGGLGWALLQPTAEVGPHRVALGLGASGAF